MHSNFWITWLKITSIATVGLGLAALAAAHPSGGAVWLFLTDLVSWPYDGDPAGFDGTARFLNAISGGLLVGWGVMVTWLAFGPIARGDKGARRAAMISIGAWFATDSLGSLLAGVPGNVVLNVAFLALFLVPLFALGRTSTALEASQSA